MSIPIYQVDAFHESVFKGNPAAVCPLERWLPDGIMQAVAMENNLSETAFIVREDESIWKIRWFTPKNEVDLCGHATLASAHVIFNYLNFNGKKIRFISKSGDLFVKRSGNGLMKMDFPSYKPEPVKIEDAFDQALGKEPVSAWKSNYLLLEFRDEETVRGINPDYRLICSLDPVGVIITAKGNRYDFVSRFFAPEVGIDEDPVTGSAHSMLIPFWSEKLNKKKMTAYQCSERGGILYCEDLGGRVNIAGNAVTYMAGEIHIEIHI